MVLCLALPAFSLPPQTPLTDLHPVSSALMTAGLSSQALKLPKGRHLSWLRFLPPAPPQRRTQSHPRLNSTVGNTGTPRGEGLALCATAFPARAPGLPCEFHLLQAEAGVLWFWRGGGQGVPKCWPLDSRLDCRGQPPRWLKLCLSPL